VIGVCDFLMIYSVGHYFYPSVAELVHYGLYPRNFSIEKDLALK
jgi:hypothetical protein